MANKLQKYTVQEKLTKMDVDYGAERFTGYAEGRPQPTKISLNFTEFNILAKNDIRNGF